MEQISINLTIEEVNEILESLGKRPYIEVFELINKIQGQAQAQLQAQKMRQQELNGQINESEIAIER
ncbi:MAG: hypothetical protein QNJ54_33600 [Prochloraceae cyanobacterium]|nr:hypothetical protein [Prochloraceae cyanobacterium]